MSKQHDAPGELVEPVAWTENWDGHWAEYDFIFKTRDEWLKASATLRLHGFIVGEGPDEANRATIDCEGWGEEYRYQRVVAARAILRTLYTTKGA